MQWKISGQLCFSGQGRIAQESLMIKNIYSIQWIQGTLCFLGKRKLLNSWMRKNISIQWKISGKLYFSGQTHVAQKSWMIKNISIQWKIAGQLYFSRQTQVAQKSWMIKSVFNAVKNSRASTSCSKILNGEKIFNTVYKRFEMHVKDAIGTEENVTLQANIFRANRYFQGKFFLPPQ